jgi:hypothetical protein
MTGPDNLAWVDLANQLQDESWQLVTAVDPVGSSNQDSFSYESPTLGTPLSTIAFATGNTTSFTYCQSGNCPTGMALTVFDDARNETVGFDYSGAPTTRVHYPDGVPDEVLTYGVQAFSRRGEGIVFFTLLQSGVDPSGTGSSTSWDALYPVADKVQDSFGHFLTFKYSANWVPSEVDDDYSQTPEYQVTAWDGTGFAPASFNEGGRAYTGATYYGDGELKSITNGPNTYALAMSTQNGVTTRVESLNNTTLDTTTSDPNGYLTSIVNPDGTQRTLTPDNLGLDHGDTDERGVYVTTQYNGNLLPATGNDSSGAAWQVDYDSYALPMDGTYTASNGQTAQYTSSFTSAALPQTEGVTIGGVQNTSTIGYDGKSNPTAEALNATSLQGYTNPDLGGQGGVCN